MASELTYNRDTWAKRVFMSDTIYEYDERIQEYNWFLVFFYFLIFYIVLSVIFRWTIPEPGRHHILPYRTQTKIHSIKKT